MGLGFTQLVFAAAGALPCAHTQGKSTLRGDHDQVHMKAACP